MVELLLVLVPANPKFWLDHYTPKLSPFENVVLLNDVLDLHLLLVLSFSSGNGDGAFI